MIFFSFFKSLTYFEIFKVLFYFNFFVILIEYIYSAYHKDGVYSQNGTLNNVLNGLVLNFLSPKFFGFYFLLFLKMYDYMHPYIVLKFNIFSFILCLFFVDFMYYIFHLVHHKIYFFWSLHIVHHSDEKLNLSTAHRISWFEQIYIFIFFIPLVFAGFHPVVIFFAFYVLTEYQFYCHSQYIRFPHFLQYLFVTPENHKIHHDQDDRFQSSNFGGVFSVWDRLFNTYKDPTEMKIFRPGVKNYKEENFIKYEFNPIIKYFKKIWLKK